MNSKTLLLIVIPNSVLSYNHYSRIRFSPRKRIDPKGRLPSSSEWYNQQQPIVDRSKIITLVRTDTSSSIPLVSTICGAGIIDDIDIKTLSEELTSTQSKQTSEVAGIDAPDLKKIIFFALPAIGVWLCNPLLSLIDTSCVGLLSGTTQQAALNPATAVTDYGALLAVRLLARIYMYIQ
jgi:hypothetical protein